MACSKKEEKKERKKKKETDITVTGICQKLQQQKRGNQRPDAFTRNIMLVFTSSSYPLMWSDKLSNFTWEFPLAA